MQYMGKNIENGGKNNENNGTDKRLAFRTRKHTKKNKQLPGVRKSNGKISKRMASKENICK